MTDGRQSHWLLAAGGRLLAGAMAVCLAGPAYAQEAAEEAQPPTSDPPPPMLVASDAEITRYLADTEQLIAAGDYDRAIRNLQALTAQRQAAFISVDGRRFVALQTRLASLIAAMPPEGRQRYRVLYDPPAQRLYEQAVAVGDEDMLRQVATDYTHTSAGPAAIIRLGQLAMDRGEFASAARIWRRARAMVVDQARQASLLTWEAVAWRLAGETAQADAATDLLRADHPQVQAVLAGERQNALQFAEQFRQAAPAPIEATPTSDWPGYGALGGSARTMLSVEPPSMAEWSYRRKKPAPDLGGNLIAVTDIAATIMRDNEHTPSVRVHDAAVAVRYYDRYQRKEIRYILPAMVQPVVLSQQVIFRTDKAIVSCHLQTGQVLWSKPFAMRRVPKSDGGHVYSQRAYYGSRGPVPGDIARYWLTAGEEKVFAIGGFLPRASQTYVIRRGDHSAAPDVSRLSAFSVRQEGRLLWSLPKRRAADGKMAMKFVSPPACAGGRVYVIVSALDGYSLLCLSADRGTVLFRSPISQQPVAGEGSAAWMLTHSAEVLAQASPPVVADGQVFVLTNAGVIAAYDASSGQPSWAYQYDSYLNRSGSDGQMPGGADNVMPPVNPIAVLGGRLVALPTDGTDVLCLAADDGRMLWKTPRQDQHYLTPLDETRVMLSRRGLMVLSVTDGQTVLWTDRLPAQARGSRAGNLFGRPAVTDEGVWFSGPGKVVRIRLSGETLSADDVTQVRLPDPQTLLGNLVAAEGRLIAANAAGVSAYVGFATARREIDQRLADSDDAGKLALLIKRSQAAFYARRYSEALADLLDCEKLVEGGLTRPTTLTGMLYRAHVAAGNVASGQEMLALFVRADGYAQTPQERAHNQLRLIKAHANAGDVATAVRLAHELADRYGDEPLVDVPIGPAAAAMRFDKNDPRIEASRLIHNGLIPNLIQRFGRDAYAPYDDQAQTALDAARQSGAPDAIAAVADRWPNSVWADDALLAAAEMLYVESRQAAERRQAELLGDAVGYLQQLARLSDSPLAPLAQAVRAVLLARQGRTNIAAIAADDARRLAGKDAKTLAIRFADIHGPLKEVLAGIASDKSVPGPRDDALPQLDWPLTKLFGIEGAQARSVRTPDGEPLVAGSDMFVVVPGKEVLRIDSAARDAESAVVWRTQQALAAWKNVNLWFKSNEPPTGRLCADGQALFLAGRDNAVILNAATGELLGDIAALRSASEAGPAISNIVAAANAEDTWILLDDKGSVFCLNGAEFQTSRWRARTAERLHPFDVSLQVAGGAVLVTDTTTFRAWAFDLATGKLLAKPWQGDGLATHLSDKGILTVVANGKLTAYTTDQFDQPIWTRPFTDGTNLRLIDGDSGRVVVAYEANEATRLEVVELGEGATIARVAPTAIERQAASVHAGRLVREDLYLFCSTSNHPRPPAYPLVQCRQAVYCQRVDVKASRVLWAQRVASRSPKPAHLLKPAFSRDLIVSGVGAQDVEINVF
ncbi:MAG: outer membrane protein assembly factor BamB family protein, partial [Planctomycetota bacterium]